MNALENVEQDIEALAVPTATDPTLPSSWAAGQATASTVLTVIATALNILYTITDGSGIGTTMSNVGGKLAALLQDTSTALSKLADELGITSDVTSALSNAISALPAGGSAAQFLSQVQLDPQSLIDTVQASGVAQTQIDLYKIAQELKALSKAFTPAA